MFIVRDKVSRAALKRLSVANQVMSMGNVETRARPARNNALRMRRILTIKWYTFHQLRSNADSECKAQQPAAGGFYFRFFDDSSTKRTSDSKRRRIVSIEQLHGSTSGTLKPQPNEDDSKGLYFAAAEAKSMLSTLELKPQHQHDCGRWCF